MPAAGSPRQFDSLVAIAQEIRRLTKIGRANSPEAEELLWVAAGLDVTEGATLSAFIRDHFLPRCTGSSVNDSDDRVRSMRLRRLLAEWLDGVPEEFMWDVRRDVIDDVVNILRANPTLDAMYCLTSIGYRSAEAVQALKTLALRTDNLGHEAMRLLLGLRPGSTVVRWVAKRIRASKYEERTEELLNAAAQLRDPAVLPLLSNDAIRRGHGWLTLARFLWVGQDLLGNGRVQDAVWRAIYRVSRQWKSDRDDLAMTGGLIKSCHSPLALRAFLRLASDRVGEPRHALRLLRQVLEAESPAQLHGWRGAPIGKLVTAIKTFIDADTGYAGIGQTIESVNKDLAIEILLCSGSSRANRVLAEAIKNETNPYVTAELMRALAMLPLKTLPLRVSHTLRKESGFTSRAEENNRLVVYLAAARTAASARSFAAFDALVQSGGLVNGHPLTVPVRGAVAQLLWLARKHSKTAWRRMIDGLESRSPFEQIVAAQAAASLHRIGPLDQLVPRLTALAINQEVMSYVRTAAVDARSVATDGRLDSAWRDVLLHLCGDADEAVQYAAASALIEGGALHEASEVAERMPSAEDAALRHALLVGQLVAASTDLFVDTAHAIISSSKSKLLHAVLDGFQLGARRTKTPLPSGLADIAVARVVRDESEVRSDAPLLVELAELAPRRLLMEEWPDLWHRWMPQSRCVLAEILPRLTERVPDLHERAVDLLLRLLQDGVFAVRRSAARSLSRVRQVALSKWCEEAERSGSIHLRRLAIEAAAWLPSDSGTTFDNRAVRKGLVDPERMIRDAAERAVRDMRRRAWGRVLLAEMKSGDPEDDRRALKKYRASQALARVGDDEDLRALATLARGRDYPPNVAYWFERTREELEKQWKKTTGEWPEPWRHWNAAIERVQGTLSAHGIDCSADLYLWERRGKGAEGVSGWGGAGHVESAGDAIQLAHASAEITLTIGGRRSARVFVASMTGSEVVLTGNGSYPGPADYV